MSSRKRRAETRQKLESYYEGFYRGQGRPCDDPDAPLPPGFSPLGEDMLQPIAPLPTRRSGVSAVWFFMMVLIIAAAVLFGTLFSSPPSGLRQISGSVVRILPAAAYAPQFGRQGVVSALLPERTLCLDGCAVRYVLPRWYGFVISDRELLAARRVEIAYETVRPPQGGPRQNAQSGYRVYSLAADGVLRIAPNGFVTLLCQGLIIFAILGIGAIGISCRRSV